MSLLLPGIVACCYITCLPIQLHELPTHSSCPALVATADTGKTKEWRNPFLPYEQALWVANMGGEWALGVGPALQQQVYLRLQVVHLTSPAHGLISPPPCVSYLLLCAPAESHVLLLNKFNIVPWHCLVVTSDYQSQLDDLNAVDLGATWRVLQVRGGGSLPACTLCMPWARRR